MAYSLKISDNGDFIRDANNEFETVTGIDLLRQYVKETILEVSSIDDVANLDVGNILIDIVENMFSLRIYTGLRALKSILELRTVPRSLSEQIGKIDIVAVLKSKEDKRAYKFWVQVLSAAYTRTSLTGRLG